MTSKIYFTDNYDFHKYNELSMSYHFTKEQIENIEKNKNFLRYCQQNNLIFTTYHEENLNKYNNLIEKCEDKLKDIENQLNFLTR